MPVLKDHDRIFSVFASVADIYEESFWEGEKSDDQFVGLPPVSAALSPKTGSGERSSQTIGSVEKFGAKKRRTRGSSGSTKLPSVRVKATKGILDNVAEEAVVRH